MIGTRKREHVSPILTSLYWLPFKPNVKFKIIVIKYKVLNYQAPSYLKGLVVLYHSIEHFTLTLLAC